MEITTIGIDLAKSVFAVCGADSSGRVVMRRQLRRAQVVAPPKKIDSPFAPCSPRRG